MSTNNDGRLDPTLSLDFGGHKHVLMSGGTGFIGSSLCHELISVGHKVTILSRSPERAVRQFRGRINAISSTTELSDEEKIDLVVNLAGAPVIGPLWTRRRKAVLLDSRLNTTQELLEFVKRAKVRPAAWIQASAIGFYGTQRGTEVDEQAEAGTGFAAELCSRWENVSAGLEDLGVRRVVLRFGLVFGREGGALPLMALPFRFALGSVLGDGTQPVNWIHLVDLLRLFALVSRDDTCRGTINAVAPEAPSYREFARQIGAVVRRPVFIRVPAPAMRMALGEMASMLLDGPIVIPRKLQQRPFDYRFPDLRSALTDLL